MDYLNYVRLEYRKHPDRPNHILKDCRPTMPSKSLSNQEQEFQLPRNGLVYTNAIMERCRQMIRAKIWDGVSPLNLDAWMKNFQTDLERYFGACILDALIYRSESQTIGLMKQILQRELPAYFAQKGNNEYSFNWLKRYLEQAPPDDVRPLVIVPVIRRGDPPTKSGPMIARMFKRHLKINQYHMLWPWQLNEWRKRFNTQQIVFVDDLLGTGTQFEKFIAEFELSEFIQDTECAYCPLVAHSRGMQRLLKNFPNLRIFPVEKLTESHNIFHSNCRQFSDGINSPRSAKKFYISILRRIEYTNRGTQTGYGNLGIVYGFQHGTPNNSIPILWWTSPGKWEPLLKR